MGRSHGDCREPWETRNDPGAQGWGPCALAQGAAGDSQRLEGSHTQEAEAGGRKFQQGLEMQLSAREPRVQPQCHQNQKAIIERHASQLQREARGPLRPRPARPSHLDPAQRPCSSVLSDLGHSQSSAQQRAPMHFRSGPIPGASMRTPVASWLCSRQGCPAPTLCSAPGATSPVGCRGGSSLHPRPRLSVHPVPLSEKARCSKEPGASGSTGFHGSTQVY